MTHLVSSFIWAMSFACLIAPSRAVCLSVTENVEKNNKNGQPVTGDCIDFGPASISVDKGAFSGLSISTLKLNVAYSANTLTLGDMSFQDNGVINVNMECWGCARR